MDLETLIEPDMVYWMVHRIADGSESPKVVRIEDPDEADVYRDCNFLVMRVEVYVEEPLELNWH